MTTYLSDHHNTTTPPTMNPTTQQLIERMKALSADVLELSADMHANPDTAPYDRSIAALSMPPILLCAQLHGQQLAKGHAQEVAA